MPCHTDCVDTKCYYGGNSNYCTECSDNNKYLKISADNYGTCVTSNNCPNGYLLFNYRNFFLLVAIASGDSASGIN